MKTIALAALFSASATAATINLDLPPGDYMLVPVAPYAVVTLQSVPIDPPEPLDTDSDGIADDADQCPTVAGVAPDGCPLPPVDTDGDGVPDESDACASEPAQTADGCPTPDTPVVDGNLIDAIIAMAPDQHPTQAAFAKIPGSEVGVFAKCEDYEYGAFFKCQDSWRAFTAYSGGAWDWEHGRLALMANGGHYDYGGNELYIGQLTSTGGVLGVDWSMPIPPQPLTEGNCGYPIYGPGSDHTYAGPQYIPTRDEFWNMVATVPFPRASHCPLDVYDVTPGKGGWTTDGATWTKVSDASEGLANYPRACYLPTIDRVVVLGATRRYMIDPSDGDFTVSQIALDVDGYVSSAGAFDTAADGDICYEYVSGKGITGRRYAADGSFERVFRSQSDVLNVPSMSVDGRGNLVIVGKDGYAKYIDVTTGNEADISAPSGIEDGERKGYIYGKFDMVPWADCVGIGISDGRKGVYLMTLPASVCTISPPDLADAQESDGSIVFSNQLTSSADIPATEHWLAAARIKNFSADSRAEYDPQMRALKLTKADGAASSGLFMTNFSDDYSVQFAEGNAFELEFEYRLNCDAVYLDCDPSSAGYKTDRRPFVANDGSLQGAKIAIIAEGAVDADTPAPACDVIQFVINHNFGTLRAFNDCGKYTNMESKVGMAGGSYQYERNTGADYSCLRFPIVEPERVVESFAAGGTGPHCAYLEPDQWMRIKAVVHVGTWGNPDTRFQLYFAHENDDYGEVIDQLVTVRAPRAPYIGYGAVHFQMHSTNAKTGLGEPDRIAWYRNLIVRKAA